MVFPLTVAIKPDWIKSRIPSKRGLETQGILDGLGLNTVCVHARCPNRGECWGMGTATFMILGDTCTRSCRFCSVKSALEGVAVDLTEPSRLREGVRELGLDYVVLTSVDRDDLPDFGAGHYAECIRSVRVAGAVVEALTPDFGGKRDLVESVCDSGLHVFAHNLETVKRLSSAVRDSRAGYEKSLDVLSIAQDAGLLTKSSLLLGLGESRLEVEECMHDLLDVGVDILVLGQYLRPTGRQVPVQRYVTPEEFSSLRDYALKQGFRAVVSAPMARTSYMAKEVYQDLIG